MIRETPPLRFAAALWAATLCVGCSTTPPDVRTWGSMREVLREGDDRGRIGVIEATGPDTIAVGALAGLEGEITVVDGAPMVAIGATGEIRPARPGDRAALLVAADVPTWRSIPLQGPVEDLAALEDAVAEALVRAGFDLEEPVPIRVRGYATEIACHVIAGACPIARPDGPPPRRLEQQGITVELVGVYARGRAGELTHHTNRTHLHVVAPGTMGHLDAVALSDAVLLVPSGR